MRDGFSTPLWLASSHLQTLGAALPLHAPPRAFRPGREERLRLPLSGGGALHAIAWWQGDGTPRPAAIVVHGVGGSSGSRYAVRAAVALAQAGWHAIRLDFRGAGDSILDAPELYHAGLTEDLAVALAAVTARPYVQSVAFLGFSLGGHVSLRFAGELGDRVPEGLRAVVAVSAPLDLVHTALAMERTRSFPYRRYVLRQLVRQGTAFAKAHPARAGYDLRALETLPSIRAYDHAVVAPMHGFTSALDYYVRVSAGPLVARIRVPTLVIHAEDDPMVPAGNVRAWLQGASGAVEQAWSGRGGHVGWFSGLGQRSWVRTWAMERALAFLARHA